jgi:CheY-like chemotaxis protein
MISYLKLPDVKTLIIADDDPDDQVLLKESMEGITGIPEIKAVFDGAQLITALRDGFLPDLVLMDLNMPNKNGLECLREIKSGGFPRRLPVVILSTSNDLRDMEQCYEQGADLFLSKPNSFQNLRVLLKSLLHIDWKNFPEKMCRQEFIDIGRQGLELKRSSSNVAI